jgi:hypothetical protein
MTGAGAQTIGVDPTAPRPDVGFRVHTPDSWLTVDLDPARTDGWIERVLDERVAEHPEAARHRGHMRRILQSLVEQQRAAGVFLCALLVAGSRPAEMIGANLSLSWVRLASAPDDTTWLARYFADEELQDGELTEMRTVDLVELPAGEAVRIRTSLLAPVPETARRQRVSITQLVVPVPGTQWLGVLVVSTPNLAMAGVFGRLAEEVARSLVFLDSTQERTTQEPTTQQEPTRQQPTRQPAKPAGATPRTPAGTIGYLPPPR